MSCTKSSGPRPSVVGARHLWASFDADARPGQPAPVRLLRRLAYGRVKGHVGTPVVKPLEEPVDGIGGGIRAERAARVCRGAAPSPPTPVAGRSGRRCVHGRGQGRNPATRTPPFSLRRGRRGGWGGGATPRAGRPGIPAPVAHARTVHPCRRPMIPPAAPLRPSRARAWCFACTKSSGPLGDPLGVAQAWAGGSLLLYNTGGGAGRSN